MKITEIFYSIQGEGKQMGLPTIFVRAAGCNLKCDWCDTKYAWKGGKETTIEEITDAVHDFPSKRVCLTGGEPLVHDEIYELIDALIDEYELTVETNGSLDISKLTKMDLMISMDYKTPSSLMAGKMKEKNLGLLRERDQLKFVIDDRKDYEYSKEVINDQPIKSEIIFQPMGGKKLKRLVEWVLEDDLDVRVLPQLHKIIWGDKKGV
ncbi:MAG: 7-carboxy-7-deazaguanine synthase QueE [Thermoplasmatota archaeon]